jgi:hypothetical protein
MPYIAKGLKHHAAQQETSNKPVTIKGFHQPQALYLCFDAWQSEVIYLEKSP